MEARQRVRSSIIARTVASIETHCSLLSVEVAECSELCSEGSEETRDSRGLRHLAEDRAIISGCYHCESSSP